MVEPHGLRFLPLHRRMHAPIGSALAAMCDDGFSANIGVSDSEGSAYD